MQDDHKCCHQLIKCNDNRRKPADGIAADRTNIAIKTIQNVSIAILTDLHPVRINNLIKNIRLNIIVNINTKLRGNPVNQALKQQTEHLSSNHHKKQHRKLTRLITRNDINQILTRHTARKSKRRT